MVAVKIERLFADVATVASASGNVKVRSTVGPVIAKIPSPVSIQGCPGFGVTALVIVTTEKVTPTSKKMLKKILNLVENFLINFLLFRLQFSLNSFIKKD